MKNKILKYALTIIGLIYTLPALASPGDPNDPFPGDDPSAPVDQWMVVLLLAGIILGIYYIRFRKKTEVG